MSRVLYQLSYAADQETKGDSEMAHRARAQARKLDAALPQGRVAAAGLEPATFGL
jgi:hypothetical protein